MSGRDTAVVEDEIVPIRQAGESTQRNYDTNTPSRTRTNDDPSRDAIVTTDSSPPAQPSSARQRSNSNNDTPETSQSKTTWIKDIAERYGSITLENKGSVARDHLALERTFLAWLRTSLAFASIGIAITQLFRLNTSLSQRAQVTTATSVALPSTLPFSPLVGHSVPAELAPYLRDVLASNNPSTTPTLGPTLLDQLFGLSSNGESVPGYSPVRDAAVRHEYHAEATESRIKHLGKPLGSTFIGVSIVILLVGFHRYFESQYWIIKGKFPASRGSVAFVGLLTGALIITCLVVIVVVDPTSYERKKR